MRDNYVFLVSLGDVVSQAVSVISVHFDRKLVEFSDESVFDPIYGHF